MAMWNEKYHLKEEWDRVRDKMSENRKKLGMRERPHDENDSYKRIREGSPDDSSEKEGEIAVKRYAKKRRKSGADTPASGGNKSDEGPTKKKRRQLDTEFWVGDRAAYQCASAPRHDART